MTQQPKSYICLDWADVNELEARCKTTIGLVDDRYNSESIEAQITLDVIEWMRKHNVYTKNFNNE